MDSERIGSLPTGATDPCSTAAHDGQEAHTPRPPDSLTYESLALSRQSCACSRHDLAHFSHVVGEDRRVLVAVVVQAWFRRVESIDVDKIVFKRFCFCGA